MSVAARPVLLLGAVAAACWLVTVRRMHGMDMGPGTRLGSAGWFAVVWLTMMAAMMLPSLAPMAVARARLATGGAPGPVAGTAVFAAGYLLPWTAFGLGAYALVGGVRSLDLGFFAWSSSGRYVAGAVVVAAGLYELTRLKARCLARCRETGRLRARSGVAGALGLGVEQGVFCVGSSGALMAALFALGVMSIAWMVVIAALVAAEKLLPWALPAIGTSAAALTLLGVGVLLAPGHVPFLTVPSVM